MAVLKLLIVSALLFIAGCAERPAPREAPTGQPQRIVSQLILGDELLWELGLQSRVVGVSKLTDDPQYSLHPERWPPHIPRVSSHAEALVGLQPDLVVLASFTSADLKQVLRQSGIPLVEIDRFNGFDDLRHNIRAVAAATGDAEAGERLVATFDQQLAAASAPPSPPGRTVLSWAEGMVAGGGTTFDDAARAAGLVNAAAAAGWNGHRRITLEQVVAWDPEVLVVPCRDGDCPETARATREQLGLAQTRAAREQRVLALPAPLLTTTGLDLTDLVRALRAHGVHREDAP